MVARIAARIASGTLTAEVALLVDRMAVRLLWRKPDRSTDRKNRFRLSFWTCWRPCDVLPSWWPMGSDRLALRIALDRVQTVTGRTGASVQRAMLGRV